MKNLVVIDEKIMSAQELYPQFKAVYRRKLKKPYNAAFFIGDDSFLCDYFMYAVSKANKKYPVFNTVAYVNENKPLSARRNDFLSDASVPIIDYNKILLSGEDKGLLFFFVDCNDVKNRVSTIEKLKKAVSFLGNKGKVVLSIILPEFKSFSEMSPATSLAERELSFYLEKHCERTPGIDYYLELEGICRGYVRNNGADISILRFDNVFAPDAYSSSKVDINEILHSIEKNKKVNITDEDCNSVFTVSYVRDACSNIFCGAIRGKKGHVYNVASGEITIADIKEAIYNVLSKNCSLEKMLSPETERKYFSLNTLKFESLENAVSFDIDVMVKHIVSYISECDYDTSDNVSFYSGRIKQIQSLEIEMIKEIDRICVENDIKYFLAGGTLLGAVRSGKAIPWDDDIDIGMLRQDYEKFRKVCEKELSPQFSYVTPYNGSGSHYIIEKVRLDGTYFSTKYSGANVFRDGIFVDVIVYDKTSNNKLLRNLHILILAVLYNCIILRWNPDPWKNKFHGVVKLIVPFLKLFPWGFYHRLFDFFAKIFENKKDAIWLIDTVGKKLKDGPLPIAGLEDTVYVDFEDIKAPIPVDCTGYLNYNYGPDYMEMPNLSNRRCPHNFARIDLGKYIFDKIGETSFRNVDVRGELFEDEA